MIDHAGRAKFVAIIMDGNSRWAQERELSILEGHRAGSKALKNTVRTAPELGIEELTAYAFSTENWKRPTAEVNGLMAMFSELIESETPELNENGVMLKFIGRRDGLNTELLRTMDWAEGATAANDGLKLFIAFNYGGRAEIEDAARAYALAVKDGKLSADDPSQLRSYLYATEMNDPDLLIRTSGELRLSNFLIWQCAYSELYFSDVLWPDFDRAELEAALESYGSRTRRYGARS